MSRKAYIFAKQEMARPPLLFWLEDHGFDRHRDFVFIHEARDQCMAYAKGIAEALDNKDDMAVFCDADALPSAKLTDIFFRENRYHLQCVKYKTENDCAFDHPHSFHSLIWRASRQSLEKIAEQAIKQKQKLCEWETDPLGTIGCECACASIARHARNAGLTTGWIGNAGHAPRAKSLVPRVCIYGK